jgi:hypothetical protein
MTATETAPSVDPWTAQLEQLRARYKHLRPAVLAALTALVLDPNISLEDAKSQIAIRGFRITAASMSAARTVLSRMDSTALPAAVTSKITIPSVPKTPVRRPRATGIPFDLETLVRGVVTKVQGQGNAEAERLREAMRKAIAVLQAAIG